MFHFLTGALMYGIAASIAYMPVLKASKYYFPLGILIGMVANFTWLHLAKHLQSDKDIMVAGFWWDSMIVVMYGLVPVLFFGVRLNSMSVFGLILIMAGIALTKVGS